MSELAAFVGGVAAATFGAVVGAVLTHKLQTSKSATEELYRLYSEYVVLCARETTLQAHRETMHKEAQSELPGEAPSLERVDHLLDKSLDYLREIAECMEQRLQISHRLALIDAGSDEYKRLEANLRKSMKPGAEPQVIEFDAGNILEAVIKRLRQNEWWEHR